MTHFAVLVVSTTRDEVEDLLAPYWEEIQVEPYKERDVWVPDKWHSLSDQEWLDLINKEWESDEYGFDEEGRFRWSTYNPLSKWDWWSIGGRWKGELIARPETPVEEMGFGESGVFDNGAQLPGGVDQLQKKNIDWERMAQLKVDYLKGNWSDLQRNEFGGLTYWANVGVTTEDEYVRYNLPFNFNDVLDSDGWHSRGKHGWWGIFTEEMTDEEWKALFKSRIDSYSDDAWFTIVDCHI